MRKFFIGLFQILFLALDWFYIPIAAALIPCFLLRRFLFPLSYWVFFVSGPHRLCDRWSSGGPAGETAEWMAVTRVRSASQFGAGADSSTPNPGKPFGTRSPLYRCWPHRLSTSGGNALPRP